MATYLSGDLPKPQPGLPYNAAQQLAYFGVVFILAPLQILTGAAMSPSVIARFPWYARLFGGKQGARTIHFLVLCALIGFVIVHTAMVIIHGIPHEMAGIALGSYEANHALAVGVGAGGLLFILAVNVAATKVSLNHPRRVQRALGRVVDPFERLISRSFTSRQHYSKRDISPYFRVNGYPPPDAEYEELAAGAFVHYRLDVGGLVEEPISLTLAELRAMPHTSQITKHNCIQGWTNIAEWGGVPLAAIIERCRPTAGARYLVFYAFDDKTITENEGRHGYFYGTIPLDLALRPQTILALDMNGQPLPVEHGAPARLRVETQLGFKMVKWVRAIEFVADYSPTSAKARAAGEKTSSTTRTLQESDPNTKRAHHDKRNSETGRRGHRSIRWSGPSDRPCLRQTRRQRRPARSRCGGTRCGRGGGRVVRRLGIRGPDRRC